MKLNFYEVDNNYVNYLKNFDKQIPDIHYAKFNKFVCGIVLTINGFNYFAPVSSFKKQQRTNFLILDKGRPISSIRFCFMFPAPDEVIQLKDFTSVDPKYRDLLNAEIKYCNKNIDKILKMAKDVYKIGLNRRHPLAFACCDFRLLEIACKEFEERFIVAQQEIAATKEKHTS
jgi:protein AbiQ